VTTPPGALWDVIADEVNYYGHGVTKRRNGIDRAVDVTPHMVVETSEGKDAKGGGVFDVNWSPVSHRAQRSHLSLCDR